MSIGDPIEPATPAEDTAASNGHPPPLSQRARRSPWGSLARLVVLALLLWAVRWAYIGIQFDFSNLKEGIDAAKDFVHQMLPHIAADRASDNYTIRHEWQALVQTLQMDIFGTFIGVLFGFPLSFFAARTTTLFRPLSWLIKGFLNIGRSLPVMIYALIVVSLIGLGAPAGALALAFGSFVMLTKLYAEGLESIAPGPVEAVRASGGNAIQVFVFGMLPQVFPNYLSATLYAFELNISASAILGIVGAGGIGFDLQNYMRLYMQLQVGAILFLLIVLVNVVDYVSFRIRQLFS